MSRFLVTIEAEEVDPSKTRISVGGKELDGITAVDVRLRPDELVSAKMEVYAVGRFLAQVDEITDRQTGKKYRVKLEEIEEVKT